MAFDKKTGETVWMSAPGGRPYDTTYAPPIIADVNGTRLLIQGGERRLRCTPSSRRRASRSGRYEVSKRGLNTGVVVTGTDAIVTHSEENLDSSEMGMMAALDATAKGELKKEQLKWKV